MGDFDTIEQAQVSSKQPPLREGKYVLEIEVNKILNTRSKGKAAITEFRVIEAEGLKANEPGSKASWFNKLANDATLGNLKQYIAAALKNPDLSKVTPVVAEKMYGPGNPGKGYKVRAEAVQITTKAGTPFTRVDFSPYTEPPVAK